LERPKELVNMGFEGKYSAAKIRENIRVSRKAKCVLNEIHIFGGRICI